jgi:hypothetical protein
MASINRNPLNLLGKALALLVGLVPIAVHIQQAIGGTNAEKRKAVVDAVTDGLSAFAGICEVKELRDNPALITAIGVITDATVGALKRTGKLKADS